nr:hypothetical protein [Streptomyces sp. C]
MHDVPSHQVSLIAVQAGSAQVGADGDDTRRHTPGRLADLVSGSGLASGCWARSRATRVRPSSGPSTGRSRKP